MRLWIGTVVFLLLVLSITGCERGPQVVVYTSHDRNLSEPILDAFTEETGIRVKTVYDTEASKTTGLFNRLLAEKDKPRADVFWNNEVARTIALKNEDVLERYISPSAEGLDPRYRDPQGYWTGFAARARVFIVNTERATEDEMPAGLDDFSDPRWKGQAAIADPHFGTTGTHFAALVSTWSSDPFRHWLQRLRDNEVAVLPGNAQVKDKVARGKYVWGLTDTDDANGAILDGKPVRMVFPDQGEHGRGTLLIPNTVALVKGGPNPEHGKKLIDFLLSAQVEAKLAAGRGAQIPLRTGVKGPQNIPPLSDLQLMDVDYRLVARQFEETLEAFEAEWPQ